MSREKSAKWAVHPDYLPDLSAAIAGRLDPAQVNARLEQARAAEERDSARERGGEVAILRLHGLVTPRASLLAMLFGGSGGLEGLRAQLSAAVNDDAVKAIVLDVDSPGGLIDLVPETAADVRAAREVKPVIAVANTWAASAAYWIASAASEFVVTPSGDVGSIGVYLMHTDFSKADAEAGIKTTLVSAGRYKVEGNPYEPLSREAKAEMQSYVDELYGLFVGEVAEGRGVSAKTVERDFGQGRMIRPEAAVEAGMADRVDTFAATLERLGAADPAAAEGEVDEDELWLFTGRNRGARAEAIPGHDTDTVDEEWDADAEVAKIDDDAGEDVLRRMYAWVDPDGDPDAKASYKFPHHKVEDGDPGPANLAGVRNALSQLPKADIPDDDREGVEGHLNRHKDADEDSEQEGDDTEDDDGAEALAIAEALLPS